MQNLEFVHDGTERNKHLRTRIDMNWNKPFLDGSGFLFFRLLSMNQANYGKPGVYGKLFLTAADLQAETGYGKKAIAKAVEALERTRINGMPAIVASPVTRSKMPRMFTIQSEVCDVIADSRIPMKIEVGVIAPKAHDEASVIAPKAHDEASVIAPKAHDEASVIAPKAHDERHGKAAQTKQPREPDPVRHEDCVIEDHARPVLSAAIVQKAAAIQDPLEEEEEPQTYSSMLGAYGKASGAGRVRKQDVPKIQEPEEEPRIGLCQEDWDCLMLALDYERQELDKAHPEAVLSAIRKKRAFLEMFRRLELWNELHPGEPMPELDQNAGLYLNQEKASKELMFAALQAAANPQTIRV